MTLEEEIKIKELFSKEYTTKQISEEMNMPLVEINEYLVCIISPRPRYAKYENKMPLLNKNR